jgi:four helix bundle protein
MAMGSADEMRVWARYCLDLGYVDEATWQVWRQEYHEIAKMLQGLLKSLSIGSDL